jgi:hypothetical protein
MKNELEEQIKAFREKGGQVQEVPIGESALKTTAQHRRMAAAKFRNIDSPKSKAHGPGRCLDRITYYTRQNKNRPY